MNGEDVKDTDEIDFNIKPIKPKPIIKEKEVKEERLEREEREETKIREEREEKEEREEREDSNFKRIKNDDGLDEFDNNFNEHDQDMIYLSLIIHDGFKHGLTQEKYVRFDHPIISAEFVRDHGEEVGLTKEECELLHDVIASHMGVFNTSNYSDVVLPLPKTSMQKFVHMCDDLSSKQFFNAEFDDKHNIIG